MIRFVCVVVILVTFLILTIPVFFVEWLIGKFNRNARDYSSLRIVQWGFKTILKVTGVNVTVIGEERVRMNRYSLSEITAAFLTSCSHTPAAAG